MPIIIDHLFHSRRKTISLIIQRDGALTVRAPLQMSHVQIHKFVQNHAEWIRKKQAQIKAFSPVPSKKYINGELFLYLGKQYPLTILASQHPALIFNGYQFLLGESNQQKARQSFIRWYVAQCRRVITERTESIARQNQFKYQKLRITSARTRWGSCSTKGNLSFTWRLVMAPREVIDYVIIHELVHTKIKNHSIKFWSEVAEILPDYKMYISWLKKNGHLLSLGEN